MYGVISGIWLSDFPYSASVNTCKISCNNRQYERRGDESREEQNKATKNHFKISTWEGGWLVTLIIT